MSTILSSVSSQWVFPSKGHKLSSFTVGWIQIKEI